MQIVFVTNDLALMAVTMHYAIISFCKNKIFIWNYHYRHVNPRECGNLNTPIFDTGFTFARKNENLTRFKKQQSA